VKRLILSLALLCALPARADDAQNGLYWNSAAGLFQSLGRSLGFKFIPDTDFGTFTAAFTGARTVSPSTIVPYVRNGKTVTLYFPQSAGVAATAANVFISNATDVPASLRPAVSFYSPAMVQNANTQVVGVVYITNTGQIQIQAQGGAAFTNSSNCGWYANPITYTTN
jgi:hypothetical protein